MAVNGASTAHEPPSTLHVRLLTPSGTLYEGAASSVAAVAEGGALEILSDHGDLMTPLEIAVLKVSPPGGEPVTFAVHGGFLEVKPDEVRVLADAAESGGDIDIERARAASERARRRIADASTGGEEVNVDRAENARKRALLRLGVTGRG